jgi:hypothetical protein
MDKALVAFQVSSNGDTQIFWDKLTKENAWSLSFAKNAFNEYKKFIHLAKVSGGRVVPSKIVDKVWHTHMTFTKSYWNELCQNILQFELHHTPTANNKNDRQLDTECYEKTKRLYYTAFGYSAPSIYWPAAKQPASNKTLLGFISIFCVTVLTACTSTFSSDIELIFKWVIGIFLVYKVLTWLGKGGGKGGSNCSGGCSSCGGGD